MTTKQINKLQELDRNFRAGGELSNKDEFHDALALPFRVEGFAWRGNDSAPLNRLPSTFSENEINASALELAWHTAGGALWFRSNSPWITIRAELHHTTASSRLTPVAAGGFDLYGRTGCRGMFGYTTTHGLSYHAHGPATGGELRYLGTVEPQPGASSVEQKIRGSVDGRSIDFQLLMPHYGGVKSLEIGLEPGSTLEPVEHRTGRLAFYGESITQGGCASRPGATHTAQLCRELNLAELNLGFSGSGQAEPALAEAIAKLELTALVIDCGHAAKLPEFFRIIRAAQPQLPVLIMSKTYSLETMSHEVYSRAVAGGDKYVAFIDGQSFFTGKYDGRCTVDGAHPNDLGFYRMYECMLPEIQKLITED